ncbi:hypothetical protein [Paenibacillus medicaginis]|uniref:Uncharacterized protein n=1 Tax=Paenibacillus medicaginis TaxID=1470560 RepID=A0ABV5C4W1_9BACL
MKWEEITELHPGRFVLVEAIKASSSNRVRQLEDMAVIQDYDNPQEAYCLPDFNSQQSIDCGIGIHIALSDFPIQLGSIQEPYGFDGILGMDFMIRAKCNVDFETLGIEVPPLPFPLG